MEKKNSWMNSNVFIEAAKNSWMNFNAILKIKIKFYTICMYLLDSRLYQGKKILEKSMEKLWLRFMLRIMML